MTSVIERAARVLCTELGGLWHYGDGSVERWDPETGTIQQTITPARELNEVWFAAARAVLQAIREPDQVMAAAAASAKPGSEWQAIIDAALTE